MPEGERNTFLERNRNERGREKGRERDRGEREKRRDEERDRKGERGLIVFEFLLPEISEAWLDFYPEDQAGMRLLP